jgi:hypothetical protein
VTPRFTVPILCIALLLLLAGPAPAAGAGTPSDGSTTLVASTAAAGSPVVQAAADAPAPDGPPPWMGLVVLTFGGLIGGLWLVAALLSVLREAGDVRGLYRDELPPLRIQSRREEAPPADWL